jgi:hypothetical protein
MIWSMLSLSATKSITAQLLKVFGELNNHPVSNNQEAKGRESGVLSKKKSQTSTCHSSGLIEMVRG